MFFSMMLYAYRRVPREELQGMNYKEMGEASEIQRSLIFSAGSMRPGLLSKF